VPGGTPASSQDWGGKPFKARVRQVEPAGLEKVSAFGIEEHRMLSGSISSATVRTGAS
jgi:hypothetical protein